MVDFSVDALFTKELRKLQKNLVKAISTQEDQRKADACARLDAIIKEMGYFLTDLIGTDVKPTRAPAATRYRHPESKGTTWPSGDANSCGS